MGDPNIRTSDETKKVTGSSSSALLLASIPPPLFAWSVLDFLKNEDILGVMSIPEMTKWFHLEEHCCSRHGTLLKILSTTEMEKAMVCRRKDTSNKMVCEDCAYAREGWHPCTSCGRFWQDSNIHICEGGGDGGGGGDDGACQVKICDDCLRNPRRRRMFRSNYCAGCARFLCGRRIENKCGCLQKCRNCKEAYCNQCFQHKMCAGCKELKGCRCFLFAEEGNESKTRSPSTDFIFHFAVHPAKGSQKLCKCRVCKNSFCSECRYWRKCRTCKGDVCSVCTVLRTADPHGLLWCSKSCLEEYILVKETPQKMLPSRWAPS